MASAQTMWSSEGAQAQTVTYACDMGMDDLSVAFFNAADGTSFAALQVAGVVHAMVQDISGSGVRYVDIDEQAGYRIHTKGDTLLLMKLEADHTAEEQLLAECTARHS